MPVRLIRLLCLFGFLAGTVVSVGCGSPRSAQSSPPPGREIVETPAPDPVPQRAASRVTVVAPLHVRVTRKEESRLGETLGEILAIALADRQNVVVVDRRQLARVLKEQELALSGLVDPATAARVGKLLLADLVVAGSLVEVEGKLRYVVHVISVEGQRILGSAQGDGALQDFDRLALEMAYKLAAIVGSPLPPTKSEELDDSPLGHLHLMRGIGFYYANHPDQAIVSCLRAVQLDPRLLEARLWISKAYLRQDEKAHARAELQLLARNPAAEPLAESIKQLLAECGPSEKPR